MVIKNKILILLFALFFANTAFAQHQVGTTFEVSGVTYKITSTNSGTVEVYKADNNQTITIPEEVTYNGNTYTVTAIGNDAFDGSNCNNCSNLTTITIPSTVTSIGSEAFRSCDDLENVIFLDPCNITSIGNSAFRDCTSLQTVSIPNSVTTIGDNAFQDCSSLTRVNLPSNATISTSAFNNAGPSTSITIEDIEYTYTISGNNVVGDYYTFEGVKAVTFCINGTDICDSPDATIIDYTGNAQNLTIPATITDDNGNTYTITAIADAAFKGCEQINNITECPYSTSNITTIQLPNTITSIGEKAFICCTNLESINIPERVTSIGDLAFWGCKSLRSIVIPEGITTIGERTFRACTNLTSVTLPSTLTTIETGAFKYCTNLTTIICNGANPPTLGSDVFGGGVPNNVTLTVPCDGVGSYQNNSNWNSLAGGNISSDCNYVSVQSGEFNNPATWGVSAIISGGSFKINSGHTVTIPNNQIVTITNNSSIVNNGVLRIAQGGQLINNTETNVGGIIEVETPVLSNSAWSFIGAPFTGEGGQYKLETVIPGTNDVSISVFDYYGEGAGAWSADWATIDTLVGAGEGFFAWSFANEKVAFTTYGDGMYSPNANSSYESYTYDFTQTPKYKLNNGEVTVTKPLTNKNNNGYWMALANPYPAKLDVATFLSNQTNIQGACIYKFNGSNWVTTETEILMTEGFFVNCSTANGNIVFLKNQLVNYSNQAKSSSAQREFVKLAMVDGEKEVEVLFTHNESAEQEYDIFDANKLFSPVEVAEPYFVTDGIALVKEEVKQLPYYATMNVRSYENKEITFKATNIPAGIIVRIIDGEEMITLSEDATYTTTITAGENADRFKVLFEQARQLTDLTAHNITITNHNRTINIATAEENLTIKVYNALGQEVLTTKDYNFTLSEVPAGAYMIKAFNKTVSETAKIVVK